jgi:hypothetical protein
VRPTGATRLTEVVGRIERELAEFYGFAPAASASAHLLSRAELVASCGHEAEALPETRGRGGVFLLEPTASDAAPERVGDGELFIGIHLADDVRRCLEERDPLARLDDANLDAYCVAIEEISHFHLILNRALDQRPVTKLELECQGEIDKLLVCAFTCHVQHGSPHLVPLARRLFDTAVITAQDVALYAEATKHAARFWFDVARGGGGFPPDLRATLRHLYRANWAQKVEALRDHRARLAS